MIESEIQRDVLAYLQTCPNIKVWRSNSGRVQKNVVMAPKGCPDIIGWWSTPRGPQHELVAIFIGFEVKCPGKTQTEDQLEWEHELDSAGGYYFVVHSVEEAKEIYKEYFA